MASIYKILEKGHIFTFNKRKYKSPCLVTVKTLQENKALKEILNENMISDYIISSKRSNKCNLHRTISLGNGDGNIKLSSVIRK